MQSSPEYNYILFSDVHLGADLVQHARPWTIARLKRAARIDQELVSMLAHYREHRDPVTPWRLIVAGDLVDFIGMSIAPKEDSGLLGTLTNEEMRHGLGSTSDHAAYKMQAVIERHPKVFDELTRFVAEGHSLVLIRGNHDIDFHWEKAQHVFVEALIERLPREPAFAESIESIRSRIEFHPWFYFVEGLLYVEHGHQYDELCSYSHLLAPYSPADPKRTFWSLADVLLRFVVRPTRGMDSEGHENLTFFSYVRFAWSIGIRGALSLGFRYLRAIGQAFRLWRSHVNEHVASVRSEHERRMEDVALRMQMGIEKLRAIGELAAIPATKHLLAIMRSMFIERVAFGVSAFLVLLLSFILMRSVFYWSASVLGMVICYALLHLWSSRARVIDASEALHRCAARIASLVPARYIVMGHTHHARIEKVQSGALYVNLGNWGVDDIDVQERNYKAPCTHLVIRHVDGKPQAEFCTWSSETGLARLALP